MLVEFNFNCVPTIIIVMMGGKHQCLQRYDKIQNNVQQNTRQDVNEGSYLEERTQAIQYVLTIVRKIAK